MTRTIKTIVTLLEMNAKPASMPSGAPQGAALIPAHKPTLHFYRYLYTNVGRQYKWTSRLVFSDKQLAEIIHHKKVEIYVLYQNGQPAGYSELDFRKPHIADIALLGLLPEAIGQGLGRFLLQQTIRIAWQRPIKRLTIQTCTLDHPRALPLYQKTGFSPYDQRTEEITLHPQ